MKSYLINEVYLKINYYNQGCGRRNGKSHYGLQKNDGGNYYNYKPNYKNMQCQLCKKYDHIDTNYWDKLKQ